MTDEEKILIAARIVALEHAFVVLLTDLAKRQERPWETVDATIKAIQASAILDTPRDASEEHSQIFYDQVVSLFERVAASVKKNLGH